MKTKAKEVGGAFSHRFRGQKRPPAQKIFASLTDVQCNCQFIGLQRCNVVAAAQTTQRRKPPLQIANTAWLALTKGIPNRYPLALWHYSPPPEVVNKD